MRLILRSLILAGIANAANLPSSAKASKGRSNTVSFFAEAPSVCPFIVVADTQRIATPQPGER